MHDVGSLVPGLAELQEQTVGDPDIRIAVLDGPVDHTHPCLAGASLIDVPTLLAAPVDRDGAMSEHGTHVTSLIFGRPGSGITGVAPGCTGLVAPVFRDDPAAGLSQLDLARAIEQAVDHGAHVISVSGGQRSASGQADPLLVSALRRCAADGVLVVAAVGNNGCACLQVPAAVGSVLAVGAADATGMPLRSSNWGAAYQANGVLAPGHQLRGALPGGEIGPRSGSSFATPVVAGIAALLISLHRKRTGHIDTRLVRDALLASATPCPRPDAQECPRYLVGTVNVPGAVKAITNGGIESVSNNESRAAQPASTGAESRTDEAAEPPATGEVAVHATPAAVLAAAESTPPEAPVEAAPVEAPSAPTAPAAVRPAGIVSVDERPCAGGVLPAGDCGCGCGGNKSLIYAIGTIGVDFGTEARRDGFRQNMDRVVIGTTEGAPISAPANPYDPYQLGQYLAHNPWASNKLIWTLNLDRTPIYALEAETAVGMTWGGPVAARPAAPTGGGGSGTPDAPPAPTGGPVEEYPPVSYVYKMFRDALAGQALPDTSDQYVSRVSIPGVLTGRRIRLFSGQILPVVKVRSRGMYTWNEAALVNATVRQVLDQSKGSNGQKMDENTLRGTVRAFLDKIYYQFRNLGQSSADRALNFAATNAFMFTDEIQNGILSGKYVPGPNDGMFTLDTITVQKSPYCRMDSDCWDVQVTFFDPENDRRARVSYQFTIDVSDDLPVSLAPTHRFLLNY